MKIFRTPGREHGQRLVFEEEEFDAIALEALRRAGSLPSSPAPIPIDRFVERYFELTLGYEDLGDGVLGATAFRQTGAVCAVSVASTLAEESKEALFRSTVAHEAGHR